MLEHDDYESYDDEFDDSDEIINIEDYSDYKPEATKAAAAELSKKIEEKFLPECYRVHTATRLFGAAFKTVTNSDGSKEEIPYTWNEIHELERQKIAKGYRRIKQEMRHQVLFLLESEDEIASQIEGKDKDRLEQVRDFKQLLLIRFLNFEENVDEVWPINPITERHYESYLLELLRRVSVLYNEHLLYGTGEEGDIDRYFNTFDTEAWRLKFLKEPKTLSDFSTYGEWFKFLDSLKREDFCEISRDEAFSFLQKLRRMDSHK